MVVLAPLARNKSYCFFNQFETWRSMYVQWNLVNTNMVFLKKCLKRVKSVHFDLNLPSLVKKCTNLVQILTFFDPLGPMSDNFC